MMSNLNLSELSISLCKQKCLLHIAVNTTIIKIDIHELDISTPSSVELIIGESVDSCTYVSSFLFGVNIRL